MQWILGYNLKTPGSDTTAGLTISAYAIPVSLTYDTVAGLPAQQGAFGYLLRVLFLRVESPLAAGRGESF